MKTEASSELLTLGKLIENKVVVIPLMQRNYKWGVYGTSGSEASAEKLYDDIKNAKEKNKEEYTIGMATLYVKDKEIQIIDGQQRLITLSLLVKALGKYGEFLKLTFQRDKDEKDREEFLINGSIPKSKSVDVLHLESAYNMFVDKLENVSDKEKEEFYSWMMNHVKIICRYTENEPLQEFLSLNEKKTPFSSTDYDRAYQMKYQTEQFKITPAMIIKEHNEIERYLYTNDDIYELIKERYPEVINRMDLIFEKIKGDVKTLSVYYDRIDSEENEDDSEEEKVSRDEKYRKCYEYLTYCHSVFRSIHQELEKRNDSHLNVNVYNSVKMLFKMDKTFKFFDLIDVDDSCKTFEEKIKEKFNLLPATYYKSHEKNAFMQSQLLTEKAENPTKFVIPVSAYEEAKQYIDNDWLNFFVAKVEETEALIEKGKAYSDLIAGGKKSFFDILNFPEIKQIIVPTIQRDYTFGANKDKVESLLFDISREYISDLVPTDKPYEKGSASKIAQYYFGRGEFWKEIKKHGVEDYDKSDFKKEYDIFKAAGLNIYNVGGSDWRGYYKKDKLNGYLERWGENTRVDFSEVKEGKYFSWKDRNYNDFPFSVIFGYLDDGMFYLYDGQQRMVTLVFLSAFLINQKYAKLSESIPDEIENYINLLKKFKFEDRKEANEILSHLLNLGQRVNIGELKKMQVDHSTYSIINLLEIYQKYENGYGKKIMAFNLEFIMKHVIFEFAVVQEASVADQLYMDLNSKNEPLTYYENYKAELVYLLSTRYSEFYEKDWKYQLDNDFLNLLYEKNDGWEKELANKAEELEIKIIHWCFKMACLEYGVEIGDIKDTKKRLRWMDDDYAKEVIGIVGEILNKEIFKEKCDGCIQCHITTEILNNIIFKEKCLLFQRVKEKIPKFKDISECNTEEFKLWFDLRFKETEQKEDQGRFELYGTTKEDGERKYSYVRIRNWDRVEALNVACYWISLAKYKEGSIEESQNVKYILKQYHDLWQSGYLQADSPDVITKEVVCDYFSKNYLHEKPDGFSWIEYIYLVKLNEMMKSRYCLIREWEKEDYQRLQKQSEIFNAEEKRLAKENAFGDYRLWNEIKSNFETIEPIETNKSIDIESEADTSDALIGVITEEDLRVSCIRKKLLSMDTDVEVTLNYQNGGESIKSAIKEYLLENLPMDFMKLLKAQYYVNKKENEYEYFWLEVENSNNWKATKYIKAGCLEISTEELEKSVADKIVKIVEHNFSLWLWDKIHKKELSVDEMKKYFKPEMYDNVLNAIPEDQRQDFQKTYKDYVGPLPHD